MELKTLGIIAFLFIIIGMASVRAIPIVSVSSFDTDGSIDTSMNHFNLNLDLTNSGDSCAEAVTVTTNSIFLSEEDADNGLTDVCGSKTIEIVLDIPPNTPAGTYPIVITGTYTDVNNSKQYTFSDTINVYLNGNTDLNAHIVGAIPFDAYAGDTATVSILVENDGTLQAQSVHGVLSANEPIEINPAESFFSVGSLQPKQSYIATFSFDILKNARAQSYPMTLALVYTEKNKERTEDIPLTFEVKKKAMFETSDSGSDVLYPNDFGKIVRIRVTNTGTDVAKEVKVQIQPQYPFTTDGSIRYIANLNPGSSSVVQFAIDVDKAATIGSYGTNVILDFQDAQGNNLHDSVVTSLTVQSKSLSQVLFADYWYLWLLIEIVVIIVALRTINKKLKTRKIQQEKKIN